MRGTISKRVSKSGQPTWKLRVDCGYVDGKRTRRTETFHGTKREAEKRLRELVASRESGQLSSKSDKTTLDEFFEQFVAAAALRLKPRTLEEYRGVYRRYLKAQRGKQRLGGYSLKRVTPSLVQELVNELSQRLSPQTVRTVLNVLKVVFRQAVRWRCISVSPVAEIELPRKNAAQSLRAMDSKQVHTLMVALDSEDALNAVQASGLGIVFKVALASGARPGEYLALRWSDLDFDARTICIERAQYRRKGHGLDYQAPKTKKSRRSVPLPALLIKQLRHHRAEQAKRRLVLGSEWSDGDLLFPNAFGRPLDGSEVSKAFKRLLRSLGMGEFNLYSLRHTCATMMLSGNIPAKVASERLGHSTVALTLDTYSSVLPHMQDAAAELIGQMMFRGQ